MQVPSYQRRRASLRHESLRRGSIVQPISKEVPWDIFDRLFLPVLYCHAIAILFGAVLQIFEIQFAFSTFGVFILLSIATVTLTLFYHNLKISASGKAVLVTGCENPLAWYLCKKLDEIGFAVFAGFKNVAENSDAELLTDECSARVRVIQIDASSDAQMQEAAKFIESNLPDGANGLWALLHCDMWNAIGELEWIPQDVLKKALDTNIMGTVRITQMFLPIVRRGKGRIVYLSSAMSKVYNPVRGIQTMCSNGIESLALCLRSELRRHGVQVIVVAAGEFGSGTAWLDDEDLCDQARTMWKKMNDSLRFELVDEKYFDFTVRQLDRYTKVTVDLTPAIHTLIDAVQKAFPLPRYTPITFEEKLKTLVADYLPHAVYDVIYN
jgi:NAD(P)-dependent dehydrogenase (short-subunit alcohol dehydrogenase family)